MNATNPLTHLIDNLSKVIIGKEKVLELVLTGLLADGHILLEDVPGVGKTLLARALALSLHCDFKRIQFTPDLTPTDVTGFFIYDRKIGEFKFRKGPVMTNILLADEINRAVPRTQSSLLEAMEERQVTIDGQTMPLPHPFLVLATQNPVEQEGTFLLPEAQLDRFLLKINMGYPTAAEEKQILLLHGRENPLNTLPAVMQVEELLALQERSREILVHPSLYEYMVALVRATRIHPAIVLGASPRASLALLRSSQSLALIRGRSYVIPDDIKYMVGPVLAHRLILKREERLRGLGAADILQEVIETVPVPVDESGDKK